MDANQMPLKGPPPREIPLAHPPLVRVIAQVRFPLIASLEQRDFVAPFQEALRRDYPVLRPEQSRGVVFGPQGVMEARSNTVWRFRDTQDVWRVSLSSDFLALETERYTSRNDFMDRLKQVLGALKKHVEPAVVDRIGVRYIDRVVGDNLAEIARLVRPEVAGILATPLAPHTRQSIAENVFRLPDGEGQVTTRWGKLPERATVDPGALEAIEAPSWMLDIDAFLAETRAFDVDGVVGQARGFAERIYSIFRWAVTDEFLRRYGAQQ